MKAPKKIYLEKEYPDNRILPNGISYSQTSTNIEYIRTDAFIEKACEWLETINLDYYQIREGVFSTDLVKDFRKAMEEQL